MAYSGRRNYADGLVYDIRHGLAELEDILDSAWCYDYAVLVDFTVPWCGPCRALAPVLTRLAKQFKSTVAIVKVDCEATAENRALAASHSISAYPTMKLFCDKKMKREFRGLQQQELSMSLEQESQEMAALQNKTSRTGQEMAENMADKMEYMKQQTEYDEFVKTSRILLTYMRNIAIHPEEEKYRRIRIENKHFHEKLGSKPGGIECMKIIGFEEVTEEDEQAWLVMKTVKPSLTRVAKLLGRAVPPLMATPQSSSSVPPSSPSGQVSAQELSRMLSNMLQNNNSNRNQ